MKLFRKNTSTENLSDKAASGIAKGILKMQNGFTARMQSFTKNWKQKQQWIFLYVVCLVFGGLSVIAVVRPFKTKQQNSSFKPQSINTVKNIQKESKAFIITENELQQVQRYKQAHPNLRQERPGLYDSLTQVEQIYYSQQK